MSGWQQDPEPRQWQQPSIDYGPRYATAPPQPAAPPRRKPSALRGCATLIVAAGVLAVIIAVATSGHGGSSSSWKATTGGTAVINPGDVAVTVHVTNTGKSAATPTCTVQVSDPAGSYTGIDQGTLSSPVQPGQTVTYVDNVSVSNNGAQYVTDATVSC